MASSSEPDVPRIGLTVLNPDLPLNEALVE